MDSGQFQPLKATEFPSLLQTSSNSSHFLFEGELKSAHETFHITGADLWDREDISIQDQSHRLHLAFSPNTAYFRILMHLGGGVDLFSLLLHVYVLGEWLLDGSLLML